jgi:hypothetical protein
MTVRREIARERVPRETYLVVAFWFLVSSVQRTGSENLKLETSNSMPDRRLTRKSSESTIVTVSHMHYAG